MREKQKQLAQRDTVIFPFDRSENKGSKSKSHLPEVLQLIENWVFNENGSFQSLFTALETASKSNYRVSGNKWKILENFSKGKKIMTEIKVIKTQMETSELKKYPK